MKKILLIAAVLLPFLSFADEVENDETPSQEEVSRDDIIHPDSHSVYWDRINDLDCGYAHKCGRCGIWFPEGAPLMRPFVADPRQITYSAGWRFWDKALHRHVIDVSFGDFLGLYEWCDIWPCHGQLRLEVEGASWAVFAPCKELSPLVNADYFIGGDLTYATKDWSFRLRAYHISSHVGDEWLLLHPGFCRVNPSAEFVDFSVANHITDEVRVYGVLGYTVHQDRSFHLSPFFAECGLELRLKALRFMDWCDKMEGVPYFGMHFRFRKDFKHHVDATYVLGYEWAKFCGSCRMIRLFLEYHDGYSLEGQFAKIPTHYLAIRISYGY